MPPRVLYYITVSLEKGVSASVVDYKLAGLAFLFKLQDCRDYMKDFWVEQAVKGYRGAHKSRDGRSPSPFFMLQDLFLHLSSLCSLDYECSLFQAAFALAFFGALKESELVSPSKRAQGGPAGAGYGLFMRLMGATVQNCPE